MVERTSAILFGHSFPRRLCKEAQKCDIRVEQLIGLPEGFSVEIDGYSGLTFDKVLENPRMYLRGLKARTVDILCVDLGTNDLCSRKNTPSVVVQRCVEFLDLLRMEDIRPKRIVMLSVIQRAGTNRPGQVSVATFNHRARRFNLLLKRALEVGHPSVEAFVQKRINHPKWLKDGCHLSEDGMRMYCKGLRSAVLGLKT